MKRTRRRRYRNARRRQTGIVRMIICFVLTVCLFAALYLGFYYYRDSQIDYARKYEKAVYDTGIYRAPGFSGNLCVTDLNMIPMSSFEDNDKLKGAALFSLNNRTVKYGYHLFDRIYPASTTKLLTAYIVLKNSDLQEKITVGDEVSGFSWDEQLAGLKPGDQLTVYDLLCGLLLYSGNDAAEVLAKHVSGSEESFVNLMNEQARALGATGTHFVNPHGLHAENHYTTVYDLYLMMNSCLQFDAFRQIISQKEYVASVTGSDGQTRQLTWQPTNYYNAGLTNVPANVHVIGGKTGTTDEAGSCLVLYAQDTENKDYISIVMGAPEKLTLYDEMSSLMARGMPHGGNQ